MPEAAVVQETREQLQAIEKNVQKVILGKPEVVRLSMVTLLAGGHLLIEDVPGVGKTTLVAALSKCFDLAFRRIQFTSDLLPTDILGVSIYNKLKGEFEFHEGPIFSNFILADEINRTTPKTQSCLLEAMNTGKVTIDKLTYLLPQPFMVLATQNPVEFHGTYPLPHSQMDRFLMRIRIGYPAPEAEREILRRGISPSSVEELEPVLSGEQITALQHEVTQVAIEDTLLDYIARLVSATREHRNIELGISPRGALGLKKAAQAYAYLEGRAYVVPDDIKMFVLPVLAHRIIAQHYLDSAEIRGEKNEQILRDLMEEIEVPL